MKILLKPKVHVFSSQVFHEHPEYKLPNDGCAPDKIGAFAAKSCYDSFGKNGRSNVDNQIAVIESLHGSVFEHIVFGVFIEGITRALSLELNRHRQNGISQRSTRYTKEEDSAIVLDPYYAKLWNKFETRMAGRENKMVILLDETDSEIEIKEAKLLIDHIQSASDAIDSYRRQVNMLLELNPQQLNGFDLRKWARGKARNSLPHSLETRGCWTGNVRSWRWLIGLRSERHAEPEIRLLAVIIYRALKDLAPTHFIDAIEFYGVTEEERLKLDGIPEIQFKYSKI
jgi:thymidylate synthase (FAD)